MCDSSSKGPAVQEPGNTAVLNSKTALEPIQEPQKCGADLLNIQPKEVNPIPVSPENNISGNVNIANNNQNLDIKNIQENKINNNISDLNNNMNNNIKNINNELNNNIQNVQVNAEKINKDLTNNIPNNNNLNNIGNKLANTGNNVSNNINAQQGVNPQINLKDFY